MNILKLLFANPQYLIIFFVIGILFIFDGLITLLIAPFVFLMEGLERIIKLLLNIMN
jgi:hypothetical protein